MAIAILQLGNRGASVPSLFDRVFYVVCRSAVSISHHGSQKLLIYLIFFGDA